jgi:hypothetical protein
MPCWEIVPRNADAYCDCADRLPLPDSGRSPLDGAFGRRLFPTYFAPGALLDASFALRHNGRPMALVEAVLDPRGMLTRHGEPIRIALAPDAGDLAEPAIGQILGYLADLLAAQENRAGFLEIDDLAVSECMSPVGLQAFKRGGYPLLVPWPVVDLDRSEAALWRTIRPSFRTNINWGRRHLTLSYFGAGAGRPSDFEEALNFVAGQGTVLGARTAEAYRDLILCGAGECVSVGFNGRKVGCIITIDEAGTGFYALGAFDKAVPRGGSRQGPEAPDSGARAPVAHWALWDALLRCRRRGCHSMELYRVFFRGQERPGYRFGTAHFKLGFASRLRQRIVWRIPVDGLRLKEGNSGRGK